jgi:DNA anti-recombination protein RmuC
MLFILIALMAAGLAGGISWLVCKGHFAAKLAVAKAQEQSIKAAHDQLSKQYAESQQSLSQAQQQHARMQAVVAAKEEQLAEQKAFVAQVKGEMEREFRLIAASTVDQSAKSLGEQQAGKLTDLLKPFREQIHAFQESVGKHFNEAGKEKSALQKEIELLA